MKYESIFNNNVNNKTMKTKHLLLLSLILTAITALQAQVRIGDLTAPRSGIGLDLNRSNNTSTTALGLPRVILIDVTNPLPIANNFEVLNGAMVYNYSATNGVDVGVYFAGETSWVKLIAGSDATADKDIVLLDPLPATVWLGANGTERRQLTITTTIDGESGISLSYRWYYLSTDGIPVATDSTAKTFTISNGAAAHQLASAGTVKKYFCVIKNNSKSAITTRIRAVYGTGVFLNNDQWLNVLNYNLGATGDYQTKSPTEQFLETSYAESIVGYLFQWGRAADGHQFRDNPVFYTNLENSVDGIAISNLNANGQVISSHGAYGKFIIRNDVTGSKHDWRQYPETELPKNKIDEPATAWIHDPCSQVSDGSDKTWRLPTSSEWAQICVNNYPENTGKGLRFKPDGINTSVFLPAAGLRYRTNGALSNVGSLGYYWSSVPSNTNTSNLFFTTTGITPASNSNRAYGFSVRCVSEE
jgi:hypothetical protein